MGLWSRNPARISPVTPRKMAMTLQMIRVDWMNWNLFWGSSQNHSLRGFLFFLRLSGETLFLLAPLSVKEDDSWRRWWWWWSFMWITWWWWSCWLSASFEEEYLAFDFCRKEGESTLIEWSIMSSWGEGRTLSWLLWRWWWTWWGWGGVFPGIWLKEATDGAWTSTLVLNIEVVFPYVGSRSLRWEEVPFSWTESLRLSRRNVVFAGDASVEDEATGVDSCISLTLEVGPEGLEGLLYKFS